jgi:hypothetical protein
MTHQEMLEVSFKCDDLRKTVTIRAYLHALLQAMWREGESFSGKRPFGNSGWEYDIIAPLVKAGAIKGVIDKDGYLDDHDEKAANKLIPLLISEAMGMPAKTEQ